MSRHFRYGVVTHENVQMIADRIIRTFAGKVFTLVEYRLTYRAEPKIYHDRVLYPRWSDKKMTPLVRGSIYGDKAKVSFWTFDDFIIAESPVKTGINTMEFIDHPEYGTLTYLNFEREKLVIYHPALTVVLQVSGDMILNTDEYHQDLIDAHLQAMGK